MSKLREALDRLEKDSPKTVPTAVALGLDAHPCLGLRLRRWNRSVRAFPWAHLSEVQFQTDAALGADTICLTFGNNEVTLRGQNLDVLMKPIMGQSIEELWETPENPATLADAKSGVPVIFEIGVCKR